MIADDPTLPKLARDVLTAQQRDPTLAPADLDAYVREASGGKYTLQHVQQLLGSIDSGITPRNLARSAVQGATMNFGDEILGKLPSWLGGGQSAEDEMRLRDQLFKQQHPVADFTAGLAGALPTTLLAPEAEGAGLAAAAGRGAATGAVVGGLSGAGAGEDMRGRALGAAVGGIGGAALGAAIPSAVAAAKYFRSPAARATARLGHAIEQSGGAGAVKQRATDMVTAGRGQDAMLADLTPQLRQATDFAANNSDDVLVPLAEQAAARKRNSPARLLNDVRGLLPGGDADAGAQQDALASSLKSWAAGPNGYGGIRDANPAIDLSKVTPYLNKPAVKSAWNQAKLAGDITGPDPVTGAARDPLDVLMQQLQGSDPRAASVLGKVRQASPGLDEATIRANAATGSFGQDLQKALANSPSAPQSPTVTTRPITFDDLHGFKQILDDRISSAYQSGKGSLAKAYETVRSGVHDALDASVPQARPVDAEYAARKGLQDALAQGQQDFHIDDTRGLQRTLAGYSPDQIAQYRTGMASELIKQLRNAQTNRNAASQLVNRSAALEDKLHLIFGDQQTFQQFMTRASAENELSKIEQTFGNSATARRLQASGFDPAEVGVNAAILGMAHGPGGVYQVAKHIAASTARAAVTRNTARELGPMLMTKGAPDITALLSRLEQQPPLVGRLGSTVLPAAGARGLTSLFDF